ncbi:energy-coupling factor transporter transmembrane component T family protein [Clostridium formicaceticum]|uniref:Energy-coupling factor transporter transmembrane protein EcfT n=1 Tax=Clostridium formicaceticum TaxID=1497 RepID=A0AAC9RLN4_9CLOT|nr:energy-coupling factor transporter transmembrane component T [Clostridium formicaceticum]AOY75072.1 transporter [Clostridium formicaceticum]ARE89496.1 Energy-coupling factor transporter transmembrane protein EcfT [Clostridium formicaceticum]
MLKDITIGQHYPTGSIIHKLDPRTKILITFAIILGLFIVKNFIGYIYIISFIIAAIGISKIPFKYMVKGLKPLYILIFFTFLINVFMTRGEIVFSLGPLNATKEGIYQAVFMAIRLILLVIGTSLLTLTTSPIMLTDGIEHLLNPFKKIGIPAHELAMMMTIALRFIPTLLEETDKIMKAQIARGADFESGNIINRAKSLVPLLVPLFISAFRRADELAMAMEARCYRGGENRSKMKQLKMEQKDFISLIITVVLLAALVYTRGI